LARLHALRRLIRKKNPDVTLSFLTNVNVAALIASYGLECRVIVSERSYPPLNRVGWPLDWLRLKMYPLAFRVVMLTSKGVNWLESRIPSARGVVIPNPVAFPLPDSEPWLLPASHVPAEHSLLLAVGMLYAGKQFDQLLAAFSMLVKKYPKWDLVILGEGPERRALEGQIDRLNLQGKAHLPGRSGNLSDWYIRAELYVMSSRFEGFPNSLLEAMAHGRAAVSYDCDTGPRDIIRHGIDGLLVAPVGDVPSLARALDRLMGNTAERIQMGERASEVLERYSIQNVLAIWDKVFVEMN
jgi:glycosyltransferase involved in cell wall biosynthesis